MPFATPPPIDHEDSTVLRRPEGTSEGYWVGAPCVHRHGGETYLGVRERTPDDRGHALTIHERTGDGSFTPVREITAAELGVESIERSSLVTDPVTGALKLYVSVDHGTNGWTIQKLADVSTPGSFDATTSRDVLVPRPGTSDRGTVKDPYVLTLGGRYYMFYAGYDGQSEQAHLATSLDGEMWTRSPANPVLARGNWHDHHTRVSCVTPAPDAPAWLVFYEGSGVRDRDNTWNLRTGVGISHDLTNVIDTSADGPRYSAPTTERRTGVDTLATFRYMDVLVQDGGWTVFFEAARNDGAFELRQATVNVRG